MNDTLIVLAAAVTAIATAALVWVTYKYVKLTGDLANRAAEQLRTSQTMSTADILLRLNELYATPEIIDGIRRLHAFERRVRSEGVIHNRYSLGDEFYQQSEGNREFDSCRWRVTNFCYTLAMLRDEGAITDDLIQRRFGSSLDVIDILEPIEAVHAYRLREKDEPQAQKPWAGVKWSVWSLYARSHPDVPQKDAIPVYVDDFDTWRNGEA
jgi:hypothetical protein